MKQKYLNNSGLSIIATVIVLLALALFAAVAVSLVTTGTGVGIQEERGIEAFYIADGGMQYTLKLNTFPNYAVASTTLGNGQFIVSVPILAAGIDASTTGPITVSSIDSSVVPTDGFVKAPDGNYWTMLCDAAVAAPNLSVTSDCEKISFSNKTATTFTGGAPRGRDSSDAASHLQNAVLLMYSWDETKDSTLSQTLVTGAKCTGASSKICIQLVDLTKFATTGSIRVHYDSGASNNNEDIFYDGKGDNPGACGGCSACLGTNGCTRKALDGGGNGTTSHALGTIIYQSEISALVTSRGVISGAILSGNIQRVLQSNVMPLQDP